MSQTVTFRGAPLNLVGRRISPGMKAPEFRAVAQDLSEKGLADFNGKIKVINFFPSLDTPVCDLQVKEFNKRAAGLSGDIVIIGISKDLPFAQSRFCSASEIKNETVISDYKYTSFGVNYGVLIKELNLLARGALIIDKNDILRYLQVAPELTKPIDFDDCLKNLREILSNPVTLPEGEFSARCEPCEKGTPPLAKDKVDKLIAQHLGWELAEGRKIIKEFKFKDFLEAKYFVDLVAIIADDQGHHPTITVMYNKVRITLTTHAAGGLTENDFIIAKIIDGLNYA
jgi:thiol peroxidase